MRADAERMAEERGKQLELEAQGKKSEKSEQSSSEE
jgi:hypothetical protein